MLCGLFQQTGTIPENLGLVFRLFTQGYDLQLKQDMVIESDRAWWQPVLQQLAWVMMQGAQQLTELRVAIPRKEAVGAISRFERCWVAARVSQLFEVDGANGVDVGAGG